MFKMAAIKGNFSMVNTMKRVLSVSLGSSNRDHTALLSLMGESFILQRTGTNGDLKKMLQLVKENDGHVNAFGLGGIDLYIEALGRRYIIRDAQKIAAAARLTPMVDGSGLKNTLERRVVKLLQEETDIFAVKRRKVLVVSAMDRFGLAQSMELAGCDMCYGDLLFTLKIPLSLKSLRTLSYWARVCAPVIRLLPFSILYPTGKKQDNGSPRYRHIFLNADVIAGDFHFIRRYMPEELPGKIVITNTVTADDIDMLKQRGVHLLVTTTPEIEGRSFGTNVMEAMLVAYTGSRGELNPADYELLLDKLDIKPRVLPLQQ